eukprot:TRINITY_DN7020_c0_g1_i7.p2 TRINITY_DN7020_c0_g1~~TRINITY_DN7020_c0_g1_i7.p2  ORF type:complete len:134 (-),score=18.33 TRINITY_DN7020_c0_g1_i7:110-511(-)
MPLDEVDDRAETDAVDHVAQRAAHDQRQGQREQLLVRVLAEHEGYPARNCECQQGEEPALPARLISQKAEGGPRIESQHPVPEWRDIDRLAETDVLQHHPLADLVENNDQTGKAIPVRCLRHSGAPRLRRTGC